MVSRRWKCPTCGAEYDLAPAGAPIGTERSGSPSSQGEGSTEQQRKAIYAICKDYPGGEDRVKALMHELYNVTSTTQLNKKQASEFINRLNQVVKGF